MYVESLEFCCLVYSAHAYIIDVFQKGGNDRLNWVHSVFHPYFPFPQA